MGINRLTGTPFHIGHFRRAEDDPRRHRSNCKHYRKSDKYCVLLFKTCFSSSHCDHYSTRPMELSFEEENQLTKSKSKDKKLKVIPLAQKNGKKVIHKIFGEGVIRESKISGDVMIDFNTHGSLLINLDVCSKNGIISFIDDIKKPEQPKNTPINYEKMKDVPVGTKIAHIPKGIGVITKKLPNGFAIINFEKHGEITINLSKSMKDKTISFI